MSRLEHVAAAAEDFDGLVDAAVVVVGGGGPAAALLRFVTETFIQTKKKDDLR